MQPRKKKLTLWMACWHRDSIAAKLIFPISQRAVGFGRQRIVHRKIDWEQKL
jgi:hypothetical protein